MKHISNIAFLLLFFSTGIYAKTFIVTKVIDGDTVRLSNGKIVRLIGVDTPEVHESKKLERDIRQTGQSRAVIQAQGRKASEFTHNLVLGKKVSLKYDRRKKDRYGRTLGYVYLKDGSFVNLEIIRKGYSSAYTRFPFRYTNQFREAEKKARKSRRGLWKNDSGP